MDEIGLRGGVRDVASKNENTVEIINVEENIEELFLSFLTLPRNLFIYSRWSLEILSQLWRLFRWFFSQLRCCWMLFSRSVRLWGILQDSFDHSLENFKSHFRFFYNFDVSFDDSLEHLGDRLATSMLLDVFFFRFWGALRGILQNSFEHLMENFTSYCRFFYNFDVSFDDSLEYLGDPLATSMLLDVFFHVLWGLWGGSFKTLSGIHWRILPQLWRLFQNSRQRDWGVKKKQKTITIRSLEAVWMNIQFPSCSKSKKKKKKRQIFFSPVLFGFWGYFLGGNFNCPLSEIITESWWPIRFIDGGET